MKTEKKSDHFCMNSVSIFKFRRIRVHFIPELCGLKARDLSSVFFVSFPVCVHTQSLQLCSTLCNPMDCNLPGSSVHEISRQEYWSGLPCPPPGYLPDPGIKLGSPALQADSLPLSHQGSPNRALPCAQHNTWCRTEC